MLVRMGNSQDYSFECFEAQYKTRKTVSPAMTVSHPGVLGGPGCDPILRHGCHLSSLRRCGRTSPQGEAGKISHSIEDLQWRESTSVRPVASFSELPGARAISLLVVSGKGPSLHAV